MNLLMLILAKKLPKESLEWLEANATVFYDADDDSIVIETYNTPDMHTAQRTLYPDLYRANLPFHFTTWRCGNIQEKSTLMHINFETGKISPFPD